MTKKELCEMCTEYSTDTKCENEGKCKLQAILIENNAFREENKRLRKENEKLRIEKSYMINPNAIGNRNDMGW